MRETSSVQETGTRKISKPPSSWRYLVYSLLNSRYQHNRWLWHWRGKIPAGWLDTCSAEDTVRNGGSGVFVRTPTGQTVGYSNATGRKSSNFRAETSALQNAVAYIAEMKPQKTVILTDSKAALQSPISYTLGQPFHQLLKDLQLLPTECTVVLQWIPAHCGIPGNERADRRAKSGSKQLQPMSTSTYQEAKTLLRKSNMSMEKSHWILQPLYRPNNCLARHEQTTILRLRTGHCGPRAHLKRIGIMDSALCDCKEAEQTVHHILQDCPIWRKQRHQLWQQNEPTTNKLWGTAEDQRRPTRCLATCGLRVWARLIDRRRRRRRRDDKEFPIPDSLDVVRSRRRLSL